VNVYQGKPAGAQSSAIINSKLMTALDKFEITNHHPHFFFSAQSQQNFSIHKMFNSGLLTQHGDDACN
jgi:hypothetical protein